MSRLRQNQVLRQRMGQKADFRLIAANQILQKNALSLRQFIQDELATNPALEVDGEMLCPNCGASLREGSCRLCEGLPAASEKVAETESFLPRARERQAESKKQQRAEVGDLAAHISLAESLRNQAQSLIPDAQFHIADYLIANISERGLLECTLEEVCTELGESLEAVEGVLKALQTAEPPGIGARSPQEALQIQLGQMAREGPVDPWAERIIDFCWEDLAYQRYQRIARAVGCTLEEAQKSAEFIRENLNPYPSSAYEAENLQPATETMRWPDIAIHRDRDNYRVEIVESFESELRISESFMRLRKIFSENERLSGKRAAALESMRRASFFLACLKMRKRTLQEVAECVVNLQRGFLDTGTDQHLRRLTRAKVASLLGKHESTVSRAVADKLVMLPDGRLVAFEKFFSPSAAPKSVIIELIKQERQGKPLTDLQISRILQSRGYRVARRTVAKYRQALRIPPSTQRRTS